MSSVSPARPEEQVVDDGKNAIVIDFIDPLFAVVLHISFAEVLHKPWFLNFHMIFQQPYLFQLGTLFLAYLTIINSWIGYHQSIKKKPIDVENFWGRVRFGLDIVLLIFYFILVASYEDFHRELWVLAVVFLIFVLWDQAKRAETSDNSEDSSARRGVTVFWFGVFLLFFVGYKVISGSPCFVGLLYWIEPSILVAAIISSFFYRLHKSYLQPRSFLVFLGIHKTHG